MKNVPPLIKQMAPIVFESDRSIDCRHLMPRE
jgi:hypothetical protein